MIGTSKGRQRALRLAALAIVVAGTATVASAAIAQVVLRNATLSNGAPATVSAGGYTLTATIGEPVSGSVSGAGGYALHAGFQNTWTSTTTTTDQLFADGYED